jgi:hypothetical protein
MESCTIDNVFETRQNARVNKCRPISLLPITSKIFEKALLKRLRSILEEKIIPDHQFEFQQ